MLPLRGCLIQWPTSHPMMREALYGRLMQPFLTETPIFERNFMKALLYRVSQSELLLPLVGGAIIAVLFYDLVTAAFWLCRLSGGF